MICSCDPNKLPQAGQFKQQKCIPYSSEGQEAQGLDANKLSIW